MCQSGQCQAQSSFDRAPFCHDRPYMARLGATPHHSLPSSYRTNRGTNTSSSTHKLFKANSVIYGAIWCTPWCSMFQYGVHQCPYGAIWCTPWSFMVLYGAHRGAPWCNMGQTVVLHSAMWCTPWCSMVQYGAHYGAPRCNMVQTIVPHGPIWCSS